MIDKGIRYEVQGGVKNYLGKQKEVKAPVKWKSSPDHPETELAYITKKEKDLLIKSDLHGSLKGSVNKGPSGIISLNGWGDASDGFGNAGGAPGPGDTGGEGGDSPQDQSTSQFGGQTNFGGGDDTREQYSVTRTITPITEEVVVPEIGPVERDTALEKARLANIDLAEDLKNLTYQDVKKTVPTYIPGSTLINTGLNFLGEFGFEKNKDFFAENVAGKYGYGYGYEDFEKYMEDRLSGKVGAYGNENMGQNAINERAGGDDDRVDTSGILEAIINPIVDPNVGPVNIPQGFTYVPYSNQVVVAPGSQGLASLTGGQGFLQNII